MRKPGAYEAWKRMMAGLPRGIAMFVVGTAGLVLGLCLLIVGIGVPILAATMDWCERRRNEDQTNWGRWSRGEKPSRTVAGAESADAEFAGHAAAEPSANGRTWRQSLRTIARPAGWRAIFYNIAQFPISIALFVVSVTVPATIFGLLLSPVAYKAADYLYRFQLFDDEVHRLLLPPLTPFQRSFVSAGIGLFLLLFMAPILRNFGRVYEGWVRLFAHSGTTAAFGASTSADQWSENGEAAAEAPLPLH